MESPTIDQAQDGSFGALNVAEARVPEPYRAAFAAVDGPELRPVSADAQGRLVGVQDLPNGGEYLPEVNPHDTERRAAAAEAAAAARMMLIRRIAALVATGVGIVVAYLIAASEPNFDVAKFARNVGIIAAPLLGGNEALNLRVSTGAPRPRPGNPGVFLFPDAMVVRRNGSAQVFPRAAILAIDEPRRAGAVGSEYEVSRVVFRARGKKDRGEYTLDVGPPLGAPAIAEVAAAERVRKARLGHIQRWWNDAQS